VSPPQSHGIGWSTASPLWKFILSSKFAGSLGARALVFGLVQQPE
jgi:hypothetical protein